MVIMFLRLFAMMMSTIIFCSAHEIKKSAPGLDVSIHTPLTIEDCVIWFGRGCPVETEIEKESMNLDSILEVKYLTHEKFLFLLKKLYPVYEADGLCRGYSLTVIDDLLEGSSSFITTLRKLDILMGHLKGEDLIRKIEEDEDLSNFFNKIYTHYYKQKTDNLIGAVSGTYTNPQDLLPLMLSFQEQLNSASIPFKALVFSIGSKDHNIVFGFNSEENVYRLINANDLNSNIFPLDSISREIAISYDLPEKSKAFGIQVFLSTDKKNELDSKRIFNAWKTSILSKQIQRLSSLSEEEKSNWLYNAAYSNDEQSVFLLIDTGVNVKQTGKKGFTPLHVACQNGHEEIVKILVDKVDNVNQANKNGFTPLIVACQDGHEKVVKILIDKGADVNQANENGATPLYIACQEGHEEIVKILIDKGADVNQANENGATPLYIACQEGHEEIVKLLIDKVDNVNQANKKKCTLLYVASKYGHEKVVKMLIDKEANVNQPNEDGLTPLHVASQYGHEKIVQILIEAKADVNLANRAGARPLSFARYKKHKKIEQMLLAAGGKC
jgi:ankyrin repeat protein